MPIAGRGDRIRVTQVVYSNPVAKLGILARPGDIAVIDEWVNAGTMRVQLEGTGATLLLRNSECELL